MAPPIYNRLLPTLDYNFINNNYNYNTKLNKYASINNGNNFGCNKSIGSLVKCAFLCLLLFIVLTDASQNSIHVDNNSYKDIVISFDPAISANLVSTLLDNVEEKIQQVSDHLFTATNQSLCFGEIIVLLPDHWSSKIGNRRLNTTRSFTSLDTDIYINSNGEMFNEEPFTDQYGQCGVGGKLIHLSKDVFLKKDNGNVDVKNMLHQWAAYRYGVFSEHGYRNDKFHPDYTVDTSERLIMTSCASNVEGETMDIIVSPLSPSADCFSRPLSDSFPPTNSCSLSTTPSTIVSSLMFSPRLSSVSTFCSEDNHDAFSPTKQNRLCDGKSINEVIRSHPDFRGLQLNANKCNTKFTLVTEKKPRIAAFVDFVNDHDDSMIMHPIITFFLRYNPLILQLQQYEATTLTVDDFTHGHPEDVPVCFDCAMEQLRGNVKNVDHSITHLYIVTAGHYRTDRFPLESYAKELLSYDIKVKVVIYPYRPEANYSALLRFAQAASAELFVVPHIDSKRPGSTYNRIAFLETLVFARDNFNPSEYVVLSKNTTSEVVDYSFKFNVDQSLIEANYSIKVVLLCHSLDSCTDKRIAHKVFINNVEVLFKAQRLSTYSNTYTFNAHPERHQDGEWEVKWSGLDKTKLSYITAIAVAPRNAKKIPSLESNFFTGSCWLSHKEPIISLTSRDRVYAYVSLTKKLHEYVHNASVAIAFYDEFGALVSMAPMVDDGLGDPDITRGDGVWSYLLTDLPTRRFIRAEAIITSERFTLYPGLMDRPCCGSSVPEQPVVQGYKDLNRVLSCGSFYIDDTSSTDMFVRSSRTFDLSVSLVDETRYIVKVDFTLPTGVHSIEDIKIFNWTERPFIRSSFDSYGVRLSSVFEQGLNKYSKEFEIPKGTVSISGPYVIAAQLKDPTGAKSLSNLVNIYLNGEPDLPSEPAESIMQSSDSDSSDFFDIINSAATGSRRSFFSGSDGSGVLGIWHVTFIVVGSFLFILVILLFIICLVAGRKRRGTDSGRHSNGSNGSINVKEEAKKKIPPGSMGTENPDKSVYRSYSDGLMGVKGDDISDIGHHIHSHHITSNHLTHQQSHLQHQQVPQSQQQQLSQPTYQNSSPVNLDNGIKGISPVDSIPANKLLSHYDKVKQAKQRNEPLPVMRIEDITDIGSVHNASSLSDNDSRFRGSVTGLPDDPFVTMSNDLNSWRYPAPVDQYQYCYTPHANYVPQNTNHLPNSVIEWRNSYDGSETISDYDPRYGTVDKQTTAVSQV